jgi:hypothetical protein
VAHVAEPNAFCLATATKYFTQNILIDLIEFLFLGMEYQQIDIC